jgi:glycosyltransferase involved in cell wall biosynthesis
VLLDAARGVLGKHPRTVFVVFGEGVERAKIERRIVQHGLNGKFILAGYRPDLDRLIPHFDLLVLPSYTEGLPNVVLEALAAGVPVVATSVGGTPEIVEHGVSGLLVPPGDDTALAAAISQMLNSAEHRKAMGSAGRERVTREFGFPAQATQYQALLHSILQEAS